MQPRNITVSQSSSHCTGCSGWHSLSSTAFSAIKSFGSVRKSCLNLIALYQWLRRPFPKCCRYWPSCSEYATEAFERYALIDALWLSLCRLLRCHPWHTGGIDPLPQCNK